VEVRVTTVSRRAFLETGLAGLLTIGLLDTLVAGDAVPPAVDPILKSWLRNLHDHCGDLRHGAIPAPRPSPTSRTTSTGWWPRRRSQRHST